MGIFRARAYSSSQTRPGPKEHFTASAPCLGTEPRHQAVICLTHSINCHRAPRSHTRSAAPSRIRPKAWPENTLNPQVTSPTSGSTTAPSSLLQSIAHRHLIDPRAGSSLAACCCINGLADHWRSEQACTPSCADGVSMHRPSLSRDPSLTDLFEFPVFAC